MSTTKRSDPQQHPHLSHLFQVGVLSHRSVHPSYPLAAREEAEDYLLRYHYEGLRLQHEKEDNVAKTPPDPSEPDTYSGQGILFAVIDDREVMREGKVTTIDVIADGIEAALDAGHEDSESIARFLTTSAFQHIPDKRVRFNSVLKAGDVVGAQMLRKLHNAYNDLAQLATDEQDPKKKEAIRAEAKGFAEALQIVLSPFTCEYPDDVRLVDWDAVDRLTAAFEKEQRYVRQERKGNPQ